jgi:hypothetical protein
MGGEEKKEGGEKIIQSSPNYGDADNTRRLRRSVAPRHFSWNNNWIFLETEGGVTHRQNGVNILHMLACDHHMSVVFYFYFFNKYQNTFDPT